MPAKTKFEIKLGAATREAFGRTLVELGRENKDVVVVDADLSKSTMTTYFAKEFPDRFFSCGIAEANMVGVGAGLAMAGKIPFVASFSVFAMNKGFEQMRIGAAYGRSNLKVVGTHSGISIGEDGPSQMSIEEIGLACSLAGFVVMAPADEASTKALVRAAAAYDGPVFIRTGRPKAPVVYGADQKFEIGKAIEVAAGKDVTLIANGLLVAQALAGGGHAGSGRRFGAGDRYAHREAAGPRRHQPRGGGDGRHRGGRRTPGGRRIGRARGAGGSGNQSVRDGVRGDSRPLCGERAIPTRCWRNTAWWRATSRRPRGRRWRASASRSMQDAGSLAEIFLQQSPACQWIVSADGAFAAGVRRPAGSVWTDRGGTCGTPARTTCWMPTRPRPGGGVSRARCAARRCCCASGAPRAPGTSRYSPCASMARSGSPAACAREITPWTAAEQELRHTVLGALKAQEFERTMVSKFLHDSVGQNLTALGLQLDLIRMDLESVSPDTCQSHRRDPEAARRHDGERAGIQLRAEPLDGGTGRTATRAGPPGGTDPGAFSGHAAAECGSLP